jgi:histone H1/5
MLRLLNRRTASRREEKPMHLGLNEFIDEQKKGLTELLANLSKSRVAAARTAARQSAARIRELNGRVRALARSGVRLTAVSQDAAQGLIELHADIVNSALTEAAAQIERMAYTESVRDLASMQADVLQAARQRIVDDMARAVSILKGAAGDARKAVAKREAPAKKAAPKKKAPARRKAQVTAKAKSRTRARPTVRRTARR